MPAYVHGDMVVRPLDMPTLIYLLRRPATGVVGIDIDPTVVGMNMALPEHAKAPE